MLIEKLIQINKQFDSGDLLIESLPEKYFYDESSIYYQKPDAIFLPDSEEKISAFIKLAFENNIPIVPRGAGTGVCGGCVAIGGGVVVSLERMNKILDIDERNFIATVEAGVINGDLKNFLFEKGYFYPPDPQSYETSSIGGNISTNAGGPRAIKYGVTKHYVRTLNIITGDGSKLNVGSVTEKMSSGYNLTELFCGSEGTLGIIYKARLEFIPKPKKNITFFIPFKSMSSAVSFLRTAQNVNLNFSSVEFIDDVSKRFVEKFIKYDLPYSKFAKSYLFIELECDEETINYEQIEEIAYKSDAIDIFVAKDKNQEERLWFARRKISYAVKDASKKVYKADVVVPKGNIADFVDAVQSITTEGLPCACFGHIGDGNVHINILDLNGDKEKEADLLMTQIMLKVKHYEGYPSGEHGIGVSKKRFLKTFFSDYHIKVWKNVKAVFDPKNMMNPGKILD